LKFRIFHTRNFKMAARQVEMRMQKRMADLARRYMITNPQLLTKGTQNHQVLSVMEHMNIQASVRFWEAFNILLALLKTGYFSWDTQGKFICNGKAEPSSNIILLVKYLVNNSKMFFRLAGNAAFQNVLINDLAVKNRLSNKSLKFLSYQTEAESLVDVGKTTSESV